MRIGGKNRGAAQGLDKSRMEFLERRCYMAAPANDMFANAQLIGDSNLVTGATPRWTVTGTNGDATAEAGEPFRWDGTGPSIWYRWVASQTGDVQADTNGSGFDAVVDIYTGSALANLVRVANSSYVDSSGLVRFCAQAGTAYWIQVYGDGFSSYTWGNVTLNLSILPALDIQPIAQVGGNVNVVAVSGNRAYVGRGTNLSILDLAQPSQPQQLGSITLPDTIKGISIVGNYAYVADDAAGLLVVDVSNPASPRVRGQWRPGGPADAISMAGNLAYVISEEGMSVVDVSDPDAPVQIGSQGSGRSDYGVSVSGSLALVLETQQAEVVDVSDPAHPVARSSFSCYANAVTLVGNTAYFTGNNVLTIMDVSDPAHPTTTLSGYHIQGAAGVSVVGHIAYIAAASGMSVLDVSNPASPVALGGIETSDPVLAVGAADGLACLATGLDGLQVVDVSDPAGPVSRSTVRTQGTANAVAIVDGRAYAVGSTDSWDGLTIYDVSNPAVPQYLGRSGVGGVGVWVNGTMAYVVSGDTFSHSLSIVDVSDPAHPQVRGGCALPGTGYSVYGVAVAGTVAYVATNYTMLMLDVSNSASPQSLGAYNYGDYGYYDVTIIGNRAYVARGASGLEMIDVSDPANPVALSRYNMDGFVWGVSAVGNTAYVACEGDLYRGYAGAGLKVIDISNPADPQLLGTYNTFDPARSVSASGNLAYVVGDGGLDVLDVSNPANIIRLGGNKVPATDVAVDGDVAYAASGDNGLILVQAAPTTSAPAFGMQQGKLQRATLTDADGDLVTFSLTGGGSGVIQPDHRLVLSGTTPKSALIISVKKGKTGDGYYTLPGISADGLLKKLSAAKVFFGGDIALNTTNTAPGLGTVTINLAGITNGSIDTHGLPIKSLKLLNWQDTDATADQLIAPWVGSITVAGRKDNLRTEANESLPGDWEADILTSSSNTGVAVKSLKLAGSLTGATIWASGTLKTLSAKGQIASSRIATADGLTSLTAAALLGSDILVGVSPSFTDPYASTFANPAARLGKLTITGRKLPKGELHPAYVTNSHISAPSAGTITLTNVPADTTPMLHVLTDTTTLKLISLSPDMLPAGTWKPNQAPKPGQPLRPNLLEVLS